MQDLLSPVSKCKQIPGDGKLLKCGSFESVNTWHLIEIQQIHQSIQSWFPWQPE